MSIDRTELTPGYSISRVIKGGWHLAGGHGKIDEAQALADMTAFVEVGITTFDCADIYTGVEELIGKFLKKNREAITSGALPTVQIHTKYVPDYNALSNLSKGDTIRIIDRSLQRLGVEQIDLVQFAWWDNNVPGYVETAMHLKDLQTAGKISYIGVTNFDRAHLQEIVDAGVTVVSNQVQYSVLDHRPELELVDYAMANDIKLLCYGVIAGGFLSDRYLYQKMPGDNLENRSLVKYNLIIEEFGGHILFQKALVVLRIIADKYNVDIAEVAANYILQKPTVAAVIIGARNRNHLSKLAKLSQFKLENEDLHLIRDVVSLSKGPRGPVYDLERDKTGKHGAIMKYNLNDQ